MKETVVPYEVRWAGPEDWAPAMKMIWKTFLKFEGQDYSERGIKNFFDFITDDDLYESFLKGKYQMLVAVDADRIIGAASMRNRNHLSLLFVDEEYHLKGVGTALMETLFTYLRIEAGEQSMSLMAAPYAVDFYRKLGFRVMSPEKEISGVRVTAMEKKL